MRYTRYQEIAAVARIMKKNSARAAIKSLEYHLVGSRNSEMKPMLSDSQPWSEVPPYRSKHWGGGCDARLAHVSTDNRASRYIDESNVSETHQASTQYDKKVGGWPSPWGGHIPHADR